MPQPQPSDPEEPRFGRGVVVIDLASGTEQWRLPLTLGANISVTSDSVYYSTDDGVFRVDLDSGAERWRYPIGSSGLWADEQAVFARTGLHEVHKLDPDTGEVVAASVQDRAGLGWTEFITGDDEVVVLRQATTESVISVHDANTAARLWQHAPAGPAGVALAGDKIVVLDTATGVLSIHDAVTGAVHQEHPGMVQAIERDLGTVLLGGSPDEWARVIAANL